MEYSNISNKCKKLINLLKEKYDINLSYNSIQHLKNIYEYYMSKRNYLCNKYDTSQILENKEYTKAYLISETSHMILQEIIPSKYYRKRHKKDYNK